MITNSNCGYGFVQLGFAEISSIGGHAGFFYEEDSCNSLGSPVALNGADPMSEPHNSIVNHNSTSAWAVIIDSDTVASGNDASCSGDQVQFLSEDRSEDDQNWGSINKKQTISGISGCSGHSGAPQDCGAPVPDHDFNANGKVFYNSLTKSNVTVNWMDSTQVSNSELQMWDGACANG